MKTNSFNHLSISFKNRVLILFFLFLIQELDEAYRVKRELYRKNSEYLQEIRNKLIKEDQKQ